MGTSAVIAALLITGSANWSAQAYQLSTDEIMKQVKEMLAPMPKDDSTAEICRSLWDITNYVHVHAGRETPEGKLKLRPRDQFISDCKAQDPQLVACRNPRTAGLIVAKKVPKECEKPLADRAANEKFHALLFEP